MTTYAPAKLSAKRSMTPEGYLLCKDVRLGRLGEMDYGPGQTPIPVGPDGVAHIERTADVLFHPDTMDSFVGKDVTIKHPEVALSPENWKSETVGHILSVRRGTGDQSDFMMGDVLVKDPAAIKLANEGCEISSGYDAAYEQTSHGRGRQTKIVGNHLAFLPDGIKGRCGPMCYVGDQAMDVEEPKMTKTTGASLLMKLFGAKDEAEVRAALDQATADEHASELATRDAKIVTLTADVARLTKALDEAMKKAKDDMDEDEDEDATMDAAYVQDLHTRTVSAAEILSPGFKVATFDAKGDLAATKDHLCGCQRDALKKAYATDAGKSVIDKIAPNPKFDKMTTDQVEARFFAVADLLGAINSGTLGEVLQSGITMNPMQDAYNATIEADKRSRERWGKTKTNAA